MKNEAGMAGSGSLDLTPPVAEEGRIDVATVRWTIEQMREELSGAPEMARVRNALAIALMELERAQRDNRAIITKDLGRSRYFPWTTKRA